MALAGVACEAKNPSPRLGEMLGPHRGTAQKEQKTQWGFGMFSINAYIPSNETCLSFAIQNCSRHCILTECRSGVGRKSLTSGFHTNAHDSLHGSNSKIISLQVLMVSSKDSNSKLWFPHHCRIKNRWPPRRSW